MSRVLKLIRSCTKIVRRWCLGNGSNVVLGKQLTEQLLESSIVSIIASLGKGVEAEIPVQSHLCRAQLHGGFERKHLAVLRTLLGIGGHAVDVGANIGLITCVFAESVGPTGRVLAIEPLAACRIALGRNLARNGYESRVVIRGVCVGATIGKVNLHVIDGNEEYSSIGGIVHPSAVMASHIERCDTVTLDQLCAHEGIRPSLVKIDTEGYEFQVLQGMVGLLVDPRPAISIELVPAMLKSCGAEVGQVIELLTRHQYQLVDLQGRSPGTTEVGVGENYQFFALPIEKSASLLRAICECDRGDSR